MTTTIHALLIEDNRIEARQTQHWLGANPDVPIEVEWVDQLSTGLGRLAGGEFDVVLLDLNLPDSRGMETFTALRQRAPEVPVVVLTGSYDETLGILAVENGAADYLVKQDVNGARLPKIVHYAVARHHAQVEQITKSLQRRGATGRVVSFVGAKGGVGSTTAAVNVAVALGEMGRSVILAELQPTFGNLAYSLQWNPTTSLSDLADVPADRIEPGDLKTLLCQGPGSVKILFGSHTTVSGWEPDAEHTEAVVKNLAKLADFVVLDLPGRPSAATAVGARLSQFVGVVIAREPMAVRCGQSVVDQLKSWGVSGGMMGAVVIGQSNLPLSMELWDIQSKLGCGILRVVPPAEAACSKAGRDGVPLILSQPMNEASEAYLEIAHLLADERGVRFEAA